MEIPGSTIPGEWLTRATVWLALSLYTGSEILLVAEHPHDSRALHTFGCLAFLAHVACAFAFHHHWSHAAAYADTARQTAQLTGWNWGGGLYINYLFAAVWCAESLWSWISASGYFHRPRWITRTVCGFFLFMVFNGAVVFVPGPARWYGLLLCLLLAFCLGRPARGR
ncbi:MAG TPA: hypothetical protein VG796_13245 [Verrucomicrobiales bacterium]|nr:hypothetical protein [Verrucomicrobiales bacterium]